MRRVNMSGLGQMCARGFGFGPQKLRCPLACLGVGLGTLISPAVYGNEFESQISEMQSQTEHSGPAVKKVLQPRSHVVPIILPISNPTIGVGLGGGLLYMQAKSPDADENDPSNMTGVFGMYTDSESWAAGGFHSGSYKDDRIRVSVPLAYGEFNLKFYGVGAGSPLRENPIDYDASGSFFVPKVSFELPVNNWFVGGLYRVIDMTTEFGGSTVTNVPGFNEQQTTAGFGLVSLYDSRDSNLWPDRGSWLDFTGTLNGEYAGGNYDYFKAVIKWAQYFPVAEPLTLVYRLDGQYVEGEAPFWDLARIRLRGFSSGQYLDNVAATAQTELRWNVYRRWYLSVFGGAGWIGDTVSDIGSTDANYAGGAGFRYLLVKDQKLSIGIDAAYSHDAAEYSIYFQVGDWLAQ